MYLRARYYDLGTQQFISRDPAVGISGQPYRYADGNPINYTDPAGLWPGSQNGQLPPGGLPTRGAAQVWNGGLEAGIPNARYLLPSAYIGPSRQLTSGILWEGKGWSPKIGSGKAYSVAFEIELPASAYPGRSRGHHFQTANENLIRTMNTDPSFAKAMEILIPGIRGEILGAKGGISHQSPTRLGWTWHHATDPGKMQLVPTVQHARGSILELIERLSKPWPVTYGRDWYYEQATGDR